MKKILIILILLIMSAASFSQQTKPSTLTKQDYLKKSRNQKTAAWIMVGSGVVLTATAITIDLGEATANAFCIFCAPETVKSHEGLTKTLAIIGTVVIAGSIPLFIAGANNKHKAAEFSFKNEKALFPDNNGLAFKNIPSLSLKIHL